MDKLRHFTQTSVITRTLWTLLVDYSDNENNPSIFSDSFYKYILQLTLTFFLSQKCSNCPSIVQFKGYSLHLLFVFQTAADEIGEITKMLLSKSNQSRISRSLPFVIDTAWSLALGEWLTVSHIHSHTYIYKTNIGTCQQ